MAKKVKKVFLCSECGFESPTWAGQCPNCRAWGTLEEYTPPSAPAGDRPRGLSDSAEPIPLGKVGTRTYSRIDTGIGELNRVLGGGVIPGSLILISGEPGIGKSTLIIQASDSVAKTYGRVLYVSGEESEEQIKLRADRVCGDISEELYIFSETNMERVLQACKKIKPRFLVIDSIQTMYTQELDNIAGSVTQIRACSSLLMQYAKAEGVPVFMVAHINKSGDIAGPKTIEHMVDAVLSFTGERNGELRLLRAFKNRFGTTEEIGAFRMGAQGMEEVSDLSGSMVENMDISEEGSVVSGVYEGSRPVFFEIQALVSPANVGFARRTSVGVDSNRLNMILAVLEKKAGISLLNYDVYVNVVGGIRPDGPSADLATALAIYSSFKGISPKKKLIAVGEVGLTGNLRSVRNVDKILPEAERLGFDGVIIPSRTSVKKEGSIAVHRAAGIRDAIKIFREQ